MKKWKINNVIKDNCQHLNTKQQRELHALLSKYTNLFDGTLGLYPGKPMHIELEEGAQPVYCQPYPVPHVHMATFKKELDHLVEIDVSSPVRDTEWGLPTFIMPKRMAVCAGFQTCANSRRLSSAPSTSYPSSPMCPASIRDMSFKPSWT